MRSSANRTLARTLAHALLIATALGGLSMVAPSDAGAQKFRGAARAGAPGAGRPTGPGRPSRPGGGGPGWGGIGVGLATGIILGTAAANAYPPPPPPPGRIYNGAPPRGPIGSRGGINIPAANEQRFVPDEVVLEFAGNFPPPAIAQLFARYQLVQLDRQSFTLTNSTYLRARITNGRPVRTLLRTLGNEVATLRSGQPNYLYGTSQDAQNDANQGAIQVEGKESPQDKPEDKPQNKPDDAAPAAVAAPAIMPAPGDQTTFTPPAPAMPEATPVVAAAGAMPALGDPAQYMLAKLHVAEAHNLADGHDVLVAVIDSGVDAGHPELAGVIAGTFDALGTAEKPHAHGTAVAGAIAAHSKLMGIAPAARILAIRAFGATANSAEGTTFAILKSLDYAASQNARVINMSFAGPADPGLARALAAAHARGVVLVAASGNFGAKSPPQYPAADPNVIAVSATDADDHLFKASNIGPHIAIAAPGVDILLPAPEANYDMKSGTSFSAAEVSGIAALMLQRKPGLSPDAVRQILQATAKDLGPRGRDPEFGAGLADAYQAILAVDRMPNAPGRPVSASR